MGVGSLRLLIFINCADAKHLGAFILLMMGRKEKKISMSKFIAVLVFFLRRECSKLFLSFHDSCGERPVKGVKRGIFFNRMKYAIALFPMNKTKHQMLHQLEPLVPLIELDFNFLHTSFKY